MNTMYFSNAQIWSQLGGRSAEHARLNHPAEPRPPPHHEAVRHLLLHEHH